jgi:hypothetical protein
VWKDLDGRHHKYRAVCFDRDAPEAEKNKGTSLEIPPDMKTCSLQDFRFRCTDNPDFYDDFWPQDQSLEQTHSTQKNLERLKKENAIFFPINVAHAQISSKSFSAIDPSLVNGEDRYIEWTAADFAAESPPFVAECYDKYDQKTLLPLPNNVKRCRLQNNIFQCRW